MSESSPAARFRQNATGIVSTVVTGVWLAAMFLGYDWWLAALLFGYIVIVPVVAMLFGDEEDIEEWWDDSWSESDSAPEAQPESTDETPLETLRRRYAAGELTDEQFEHKLEQLLETETIEDVEGRTERERLRETEP